MPEWANDVQDKTRRLQIKLYLAAKRSRNRRFHALYQHIFHRDMLERAWYEVRRNRGAPGVDGVTIGQTMALSVSSLHAPPAA